MGATAPSPRIANRSVKDAIWGLNLRLDTDGTQMRHGFANGPSLLGWTVTAHVLKDAVDAPPSSGKLQLT